MAKKIIANFTEPITFLLLGEKSDKLRSLLRETGISDKVDILGQRSDVPEVMALLHLFIKISLKEKISLSLIEAQASGVPCILPRIKGLSDFTLNEKNGILVEPGNADAYAKEALKLLRDPALVMKMSKLSFDYVANNMTADIGANLLINLYEEILES